MQFIRVPKLIAVMSADSTAEVLERHAAASLAAEWPRMTTE
jgi:hypothetical protein